ncbi:MAG: hypothetical protein HFE43_08680 [Oscillospiraceae bacterium]|nr:hypothetical protein [Oscillospiraceae bacterium]
MWRNRAVDTGLHCRDCRWCFRDTRPAAYRRDSLCFCRKKGPFFSRNHRPGEGARILPGDAPCPLFAPGNATAPEK